MTKYIILLFLALTAIQGLNADTLLKRNIFDDIASVVKNELEKADQVLKNFSAIAAEKIKADEQKVAERINATKDFFKGLQGEIANILHHNSTTQKRSPGIVDNFVSQTQSFINMSQSLGKHSPWFFNGTMKRSLFGDFLNKTKELAEKFEQDVQEKRQKIDETIKGIIDGILHRNSTSNSTTAKRSFLGDLVNKTKTYAEQVKEKLGEAAEEGREKFEEFLKELSQRISQNTSGTSKRSLSFDSGLSFINDLRSKLDAAVQNVKQHLSDNANNTFLDNLKNIASHLVSTKFNLTEISSDVSECVNAEKTNVSTVLDQAKSQLEEVIEPEQEAAEPFLKNVSVTAPKVANLLFTAAANATSCGEDYVCLAVVAFNIYNQAVVLEPEVVQEIQAGVALAKSLAADAKTINEQIVAPAFSKMIAIAQESISCIEGKMDA